MCIGVCLNGGLWGPFAFSFLRGGDNALLVLLGTVLLRLRWDMELVLLLLFVVVGVFVFLGIRVRLRVVAGCVLLCVSDADMNVVLWSAFGVNNGLVFALFAVGGGL